MSTLLQQGREAKDYGRLVAYLKELTPSRLDSELRSMQAGPPLSQLRPPCERLSEAMGPAQSADACCDAAVLVTLGGTFWTHVCYPRVGCLTLSQRQSFCGQSVFLQVSQTWACSKLPHCERALGNATWTLK